MKKKTTAALLAAVMIAGTAAEVGLAATPLPQYVSVVMNGVKIHFPDAHAYVNESSRTMVPVRFVTENFGAGIQWDGATQSVAIQWGEKDIRLAVGESKATVNGVDKLLDTSVTLHNGRTYVPLRFVSEALEANVTWDGQTETVIIKTSDFKPAAETKFDAWGRKIRTTNLPSNYQDWPYILEDVPNSMYEMSYVDKWKEGIKKTAAYLYQNAPEFQRKNIDYWMRRVKNYYEVLWNVDYHTIDETYVQSLWDEMNRGIDYTHKLRNFVNWAKTNEIQMEGLLEPEPSMVFQHEGGYRVRSKFKFRFLHFNENKNLFHDQFYNNFNTYNFQKNIWYEGYVDIDISTNIGGQWGKFLAVDPWASLFLNSWMVSEHS